MRADSLHSHRPHPSQAFVPPTARQQPCASGQYHSFPLLLLPHLQLISTADKLDYVLLVVGTIGAMGNGICWPIFAVIFGDFTDAFGTIGKAVHLH